MPIVVHFSPKSDTRVLCEYVPPNGWAADMASGLNSWSGDQSQMSCAACLQLKLACEKYHQAVFDVQRSSASASHKQISAQLGLDPNPPAGLGYRVLRLLDSDGRINIETQFGSVATPFGDEDHPIEDYRVTCR